MAHDTPGDLSPASIESDRLTLVPLSLGFLEASLAGDAAGAGELIGLRVPPEWLEERWLMELRRGQLRDDPAYHSWGPRAIGDRASGAMIGHIGFHSGPGPDYLAETVPGGVEIGYTIFPAFRRRGYASEAVAALMGWAAGQGVRRFVLSISPENAPSLAIAARFGFRLIGSQIDEEDGLEQIFLRDLDEAAG
jgi:RimJ/RimL family protein N-acetyltransferase